MFKRKGGGVKGLLNNVKKTALFLRDGFPTAMINCLMLDKHLDNHSILRKHFASVLMNMVSQATITTEGKY